MELITASLLNLSPVITVAFVVGAAISAIAAILHCHCSVCVQCVDSSKRFYALIAFHLDIEIHGINNVISGN